MLARQALGTAKQSIQVTQCSPTVAHSPETGKSPWTAEPWAIVLECWVPCWGGREKFLSEQSLGPAVSCSSPPLPCPWCKTWAGLGRITTGNRIGSQTRLGLADDVALFLWPHKELFCCRPWVYWLRGTWVWQVVRRNWEVEATLSLLRSPPPPCPHLCKREGGAEALAFVVTEGWPTLSPCSIQFGRWNFVFCLSIAMDTGSLSTLAI